MKFRQKTDECGRLEMRKNEAQKSESLNALRGEHACIHEFRVLFLLFPRKESEKNFASPMEMLGLLAAKKGRSRELRSSLPSVTINRRGGGGGLRRR